MGIGPELIRRARLEARLTQAELARRARTSQSAVAAYESGAKTPTVDTLDRILRAAGRQLGSSKVRSSTQSATRLGRLLRKHRAEIEAIAAEHHASNVRVFGSVARGQDGLDSDVDLLVDMDAAGSLFDQVRLRRALKDLLGVEVDVVSSAGLLSRDSAIRDEAVAL
ncbi:MAG: helix-turn-helix domain-containing protein [Actinomycetota bacterium]